MTMIKVEGNNYKVTENLRYQNGYYVKAVDTPDGEKIAVKQRGGTWKWWTVHDRVNKEKEIR